MKTICYRCCELLSVFFSGLLDRFFSLCAAVCLADVSVFVAAVSVLVLAVSTFVLLYDMCVLCRLFWLLYHCVLLAAVSDCLATASGFCYFCVGSARRPVGACFGWSVGGLMRDVTREVLARD